MYCKYCGKPIYGTASFCQFCGGKLEPQTADAVSVTAADGETTTAVSRHRTPRMSAGGKVWCAVCMLANTLLIIYMALMLAKVNERTAYIVSIVSAALSMIGYLVLLTGNREGFYTVFLAAAGSIVINILANNYLAAALGLLNPIITWLIIKSSWERMGMPFEKPKSRNVALILACLPYTGLFGIDKFYLGYFWLGLLKMLTGGGFMVWYIVDIVKLAKGTTHDKYGTPLFDARKR